MTTPNRTAALEADGTLPLAGAAPIEPSVVIEGGQTSLRRELRALWEFRELLYFLVWRDVKARYKQTVLGIGLGGSPASADECHLHGDLQLLRPHAFGWPALSALRLRGAPPVDLLLPGRRPRRLGLVFNASLVSKVYFPRLIIPMAARGGAPRGARAVARGDAGADALVSASCPLRASPPCRSSC